MSPRTWKTASSSHTHVCRAAVQAGVGTVDYGPIEVDSPMKEDPKFMDVWKLKRLYKEPVLGSKVRRAVDDLVQRDQQIEYSLSIAEQLQTKRTVRFEFGGDETYILTREADSPAPIVNGNVVIPAGGRCPTSCSPGRGLLLKWHRTQRWCPVRWNSIRSRRA